MRTKRGLFPGEQRQALVLGSAKERFVILFLVIHSNVGQIKIEEKELHSKIVFLKAIISLSNSHERKSIVILT